MYLNLYTHNVSASQHFSTGSLLDLFRVCVYTLHYMSASSVGVCRKHQSNHTSQQPRPLQDFLGTVYISLALVTKSYQASLHLTASA